MIISLNWLKKYVDVDVLLDELTTLIGARLVEIEDVVDIREKYKDCVVVRVVECERVDGSDHLSLTKIDDCGIIKDVDRDKDGLVQVVCGAPNVRADMFAVWLPPKSLVPETYGTDEPFILGSRKLKGLISHGMLAGLDELDMGERSSGIAEINPSEAKVGDRLSDIFGLDDILLDIENKSLTHRPDCFGVVGFAREVAGILGKEFKTPRWLTDAIEEKTIKSDVEVSIKIEDADLCPRYEAVVMKKDSNGGKFNLDEMGTWLARSGMRPIDKIVDVTNYLMLLSGQPLHAFDYDKLVEVGGKNGAEITVRAARAGEKLELLDGRIVELDASDIVITSSDVPVALAGAMGGKSTAIDEGTERIVIESATFNLYNLRTTQMRHGIFSEAITRFTKGQPPELTDRVIRQCVELLSPDMKQISDVFDCYERRVDNEAIDVSAEEVNEILGTDYSYSEIEKTLRNVGFEISCGCGKDDKCECEKVSVLAPYWRTDIHIKEDVAEEVGRLNGFDSIDAVLPVKEFRAAEVDRLGGLKADIRNILSSAGANEVLTYSFVNSDLVKKAGQDEGNSYKIINSISPDLEYCRQSLTPSLLSKVSMNLKQGFDKFALFEIGKVYQKDYGLNDEDVPVEKNKAALVFVDKKSDGKVPYYQAKRYAEFVFARLGMKVRFVKAEADNASNKPYEKLRAAQIKDVDTGVCYGICGEFRKTVQKNFKLPEFVAGFELNVDEILKALPKNRFSYRPISRYPSVERDICLKVDEKAEFAKLDEKIKGYFNASGLNYDVSPIDVYKAEGSGTKNVTFRLKFGSMDRTLSSDDIADIMGGVTKVAEAELGAEII